MDYRLPHNFIHISGLLADQNAEVPRPQLPGASEHFYRAVCPALRRDYFLGPIPK